MAARVADGQRQRVPAGEAAELDERRRHRRVDQDLAGLVDPDAAVTGDEADPVGERDHALEPVLGEEHGQAEVVDQAGDGREDLLGRRRVEGGGGLVEDQHAGVGGQHRPDGDALLLAAGEGAEVARAQVGDAEQVERLLDPAAHRLRSGAELLHAVRELLLDRVGDEPGERVLTDVPDEVRPLARRLVDDAARRRAGRRR